MFKKKRKKLSFKKSNPLSKSNQGILIAFRKGYTVSENGNVYNPKGKQLAVNAAAGKYPTITVTEDNVSYNVPVHRLAAYCFYGSEMFKTGLLVRHLNGNVLDVRRENIALGTQSENSMDRPQYQRVLTAVKGRKAQKRRAHNAKFSPEEVKEIRTRRSSGETLQSIANDFKITRQAVYRIVKRICYQDIE